MIYRILTLVVGMSLPFFAFAQGNGAPETQEFDFDEYLSSEITQKVFQRTVTNQGQSIPFCEIITLNDVRNDAPAGRTLNRQITFSRPSGFICTTLSFEFISLNESKDVYFLKSNHPSYSEQPNNSTGMYLWNPNKMFAHMAYGDGGTMTRNLLAGGSETRVLIRSFTPQVIEDVSVPAGNFAGCLKAHEIRGGDNLFGHFDGYRWFCPDVGEVKRVRDRGDGNMEVWQLESFVKD